MLNDSTSIWRGSDDQLHVGETRLEIKDRGTRAVLTFPPDVPPYALEGLFTAAAMRYGEVRAFGDDSPVRYLRALTGPCVLEDSYGSGINLYPVIKLYETGVLLVEMRLFSGGRSENIGIGELVQTYVQAQSEEYIRAHVPPIVAELAPVISSEWSGASFRERIRLTRAMRVHSRAVAESVTHDTSGDFDTSFCALPAAKGEREKIKGIALLLADIVGYLASKPRTGLGFILLGQRPLLTVSRWSGRPHVHLFKFSEQSDSARVNEARHGVALASILAGVPNAPITFMTDNLRNFDDYGVYVTRSAQLWVYTPSSLITPASTLADPNYGYVVYEQEAVAELLEYAYALNKRLEDEASAPSSDPRLIARLRILLVHLATEIDSHVHIGEIRDILRRGFRELGIPELQERTSALLAARMELLTYEEEQRTSRWAVILSVIFGFLAVPPLANDVVAPLWRLWGWQSPVTADASQLFFTGIASGVVLLAVAAARFVVLRRKR